MADLSDALVISEGSRGVQFLDRETTERIFSHPNVVEVPAGEGKEPAKILKMPGFWAVDHGTILTSYDEEGGLNERDYGHAVFYASFLFQAAGEVRILTLPVDLFKSDYRAYLLGLMTDQGIPLEKAQRDCSDSVVSEVFGRLDREPLRDLICTLHDSKPGAVVVQGYNPRYGGMMESGWGRDQSLTVIGRERSNGLYRHNLYASVEGRLTAGVEKISQPVKPETTDPYSIEITKRILRANGIQ